MKYWLENSYQDSGWERLDGEEFEDGQWAISRARKLASDAICYGMVRVMTNEGVLKEFAAGGNSISPIQTTHEEDANKRWAEGGEFDEKIGIGDYSPDKIKDYIAGEINRLETQISNLLGQMRNVESSLREWKNILKEEYHES